MVDELIPANPKDTGDGDGKEHIAKSQAAVQNVKKESSREKAKRYANRSKEQLKKALKFIGPRIGSSGFWTAAATVAMAVTTGIYTYYAKQQWREMKSSGAQTDTVLCLSGQQLFALQQQSRETHNLAQTTRDAVVQVQRAIMSADTLVMSRQLIDGKFALAYFFVGWKNSGTTPTVNLSIHHNYQPNPTSMPSTFSYPDKWNKGEPHISTPAFATPQQPITVEPTIVTADVIREVQQHKLRLIFWGEAKYRDVFRGTPDHISEYCVEVTGFYGDPFSTNPAEQIPLATSNCKTHNCHDEECGDQPKSKLPIEVPLPPLTPPVPCRTPKPN